MTDSPTTRAREHLALLAADIDDIEPLVPGLPRSSYIQSCQTLLEMTKQNLRALASYLDGIDRG